MSPKKKKNNNNNNKAKLREERLRDIQKEDSELDEIEKLIASSEIDNEENIENKAENDSDNIIDEDTLSDEIETSNDKDVLEDNDADKKENLQVASEKDNEVEKDEEDDFFKKLEKDEIKTFKQRKDNDKEEVLSMLSEIISSNKKIIVWGSVLAVLIIALIIALVVDASSKKNSSDSKLKKVSTAGQLSAVECTDSEIVGIVEKYFEALANGDFDTLSNVMDSTDNINPEVLKKESEYIDGYVNIKCYAKEGLTEGENVVFVSYENQIMNIATPAPGAVVLYIKKSEDGSYKIHNGIKDSGISELVDKYSKEKDIKEMNEYVNIRFKEACEKDEDLEMFYNALINASSAE